MERMMPGDIDLILQSEHKDRYRFVLPLLSGQVLDMACGIGYGAEVVLSAPDVKSYSGLDLDKEAIEIAREHFESDQAKFKVGDITKIDLADDSIDSALSFETLEHLETPLTAVEEMSRVVAKNGIWLGSVPTVEFDEKCESVYGKNPYHITRFTQRSLFDLLSKHFKHVEIFFNQLLVSSSFSLKRELDFKVVSTDNAEYASHGSLMFFATNDQQKLDCFRELKSTLAPICSVVEYDQERVAPVREAFKRAESMVVERDSLILSYEKAICELEFKERQSRDQILRLESQLSRITSLFLVKIALKFRAIIKVVLGKS